MEHIQINFLAAENEASRLEQTAAIFRPSTLDPEDDTTTLTANSQLKSAVREAQALLADFGTAINTEAANIRSTGTAFQEQDQMMADAAEQFSKG